MNSTWLAKQPAIRLLTMPPQKVLPRVVLQIRAIALLVVIFPLAGWKNGAVMSLCAENVFAALRAIT